MTIFTDIDIIFNILAFVYVVVKKDCKTAYIVVFVTICYLNVIFWFWRKKL